MATASCVSLGFQLSAADEVRHARIHELGDAAGNRDSARLRVLVGLPDDSGDLAPMRVAAGQKQAIDVGGRDHFAAQEGLSLLRLDLVVAQSLSDDTREALSQAIDLDVDLPIESVDLPFHAIDFFV